MLRLAKRGDGATRSGPWEAAPGETVSSSRNEGQRQQVEAGLPRFHLNTRKSFLEVGPAP